MAKRFSLRQFFNSHPLLDRTRINTLACTAAKSTMWYTGMFNSTQLFSRAAEDVLFGPNRRPILFAVYHGHMCASMYLPRRAEITGLASASRDGEIVARMGELMGFATPARGSPAHGAVKGGIGMLHAAQKGHNLLFFVDGPRGPKEIVKAGVIRLAQMAGTPIVPVVAQARHYWNLPSWDSYLFPHWSSPYIQMYGDPISVPEGIDGDDIEQLRAQLDGTMREMTVNAHQLAMNAPR
jgi:lysophospholipid acyltransferase (LPLAT)-like uncharacterized protein